MDEDDLEDLWSGYQTRPKRVYQGLTRDDYYYYYYKATSREPQETVLEAKWPVLWFRNKTAAFPEFAIQSSVRAIHFPVQVETSRRADSPFRKS